MGIAIRPRVSVPDPLLDFSPESTVEYAEHGPEPSPWPVVPAPTHAIDTTSRVVSFVLGFALASLIAWLGSISGNDVAATSEPALVAAAVTPVVPATIEEKTIAPTPLQTVAPPPPPPVATAQPVVKLEPRRPAAVPARVPAPVVAAHPPPRPAVAGYRGTIVFSSTPEGADVLVNGQAVGQTPVVINDLPVGSRVIVVRREGYAPWTASVRVVANQRTTVRATLVPTHQTGG